MRRVPFNAVDDLIFHLAEGHEPWSVHCELGLTGRLEAGRLREAAQRAAARHPMLRARVAPPTALARDRQWSLGAPLEVPVSETDCADEEQLDEARGELLSRQLDLAEGPPAELLLVHGPEGDNLIVHLDHAAGDGLSAYRLLLSVARAYAGDPDPVPDWDVLERRSLHELAGAHSARDVAVRARGLVERVREPRAHGPVARVARTGSDNAPAGFGFMTAAFDAEQTAQLMRRREAPATVNDLLVASLAVTIAAFNRRHGLDPRTVSVMMPVSLRDAAWASEVVSNIVSFVSVSVLREAQGDVRSAQRAVAERTRAMKADRRAGTLIDVLDLTRLTPLAVRRTATVSFGRESVGRFLDTAVLSNLGRLEQAPDFGPEAGDLRGLWFSPPARMPLGVAAGAATVDGRLFLTVRHCHAQFDRAGASSFIELWRAVLLQS